MRLKSPTEPSLRYHNKCRVKCSCCARSLESVGRRFGKQTHRQSKSLICEAGLQCAQVLWYTFSLWRVLIGRVEPRSKLTGRRAWYLAVHARRSFEDSTACAVGRSYLHSLPRAACAPRGADGDMRAGERHLQLPRAVIYE